MAKGYLIDSNAIIEFLNGSLPEGGKQFLLNVQPNISIITRIEIFCSKRILEQELLKLNQFVAFAKIYNIDSSIIEKTIQLRLEYKIKLPDAIIAATAICYDLTLLTRNVSDFSNIANLDVLDPYSV